MGQLPKRKQTIYIYQIMASSHTLIFFAIMGLVKCFYLPNEGSKETNKCTTSLNETGKCVQITEWEVLEGFLDAPLDKTKVKFLEKENCGFFNEIPKICCPIKGRKEEETTTTTTVVEIVEIVEDTTASVKISDEFGE